MTLHQLIEGAKVQRDLSTEASRHQDVLLLVLSDEDEQLLRKVSVAFDVVEELHEDHDVDVALVLDIVEVEDGLVPSLWRVVKESVEDPYKLHEIYFGVVQPLGHSYVQHLGEDIAWKPK